MEMLEAITAKLAMTEEVRGVVRTMKALSGASIHSYERAREAIGAYERTVELGLQVVLRNAGAPRQRLRARSQRAALIVIGSDRGLCGRFNDRIASYAVESLRSLPAATGKTYLAVAGNRIAARMEASGYSPDRFFSLPGSVAGLAGTVRAMTLQIDHWLAHDRIETVMVIYNRRGHEELAVPERQTLLPVSEAYLSDLAHKPWRSRSLPIFLMDREQLLSWLIGEHLFVLLYRALSDSLASEHASRLAAMQGAERNLEERHAALLASYRLIRQQAITSELLEIITGYELASSAGIRRAEGGQGVSPSPENGA